MAAAADVRRDFTSQDMRRLLELSMILDGGSRSEVASAPSVRSRSDEELGARVRAGSGTIFWAKACHAACFALSV